MKNIFRKKLTYLLIGGVLLGPIACKEDFLDVPVTEQLTEATLANQRGIEGLLIGAYSALNGKDFGWFGGATNWLWGSIRGGDANKGSNAGDFNTMSPIQRFELDAVNPEPGGKWGASYEGITRANYILFQLKNVTDIDEAGKTRIAAEARFLRGHYYFELKKTFNMVPWIDETTNLEAGKVDVEVRTKQQIPNNTDIWPKIEEDFKFAFDNLPATQPQVGRANKWAAGAYLGKTYLYQKKWTEAKAIFDQVIANGQTSNGLKYALVPNFKNLWRGVNENNSESVFAFQAAAGTGNVNNTNHEIAMNYPYNTGPNGPGECCGFYAPSFELVNSYRTDAVTGLPLLDESYRTPVQELKSDQGIQSNALFTPDTKSIDPRLDNSIGRRGIPFLDWGPHPGFAWIRDQSFAGPFTQKKFSYERAEKGRYQDGSSWTPGYQSINFMYIRFADVLLMAAEAEVELGNLDVALEYVNRVRARAANPAGFVKGAITGYQLNDKGETDYTKPILDMSQDAATYNVAPYPAFPNQEFARQAVRFERKLELALEGHRFFDLVRWGVAEKEINEYLAYEGAKLTTNLGGARFQAGKHEFLPIPQRQIDLQGDLEGGDGKVLTQNPGYL
jgi:starch-binding outer membrane protein, SusD/RagB family